MDEKEKKTGGDPEIIPTENSSPTTDGVTPTPEAEQTADGNKQTIDLDIVSKTVENRQYHPGFVSACQLIWDPKKYNLEFYNEHAITVEPIRTDLLILKREPGAAIPDQIGAFFRTYNFIQFKSESDKFSSDDLFKELSYVFEFKYQHSKFQFDQCSLSVFCSSLAKDTLSDLKKYGFTVQQAKDPNITYVDLWLGIKMQIVKIGNLVGNNNEYAPINMFSSKLDDVRVQNLVRFKETHIQVDDKDQLKLFEAILSLMYDKKHKTMEDIINHLKEVDPVSHEQLCTSLFPDILAAREKAGYALGEESMLDIVLRNIRNTALRSHTSYEDELDRSELPEWCSREEALKRMNAMSSTRWDGA